MAAKSMLFVMNDAPYGNERTYHALRFATGVQMQFPDVAIRLFLKGDGVAAAVAGQKPPTGYYNIETLLKALIAKGAAVLA